MSLEDMYHYADDTAAELEQEYIENNWKTNNIKNQSK